MKQNKWRSAWSAITIYVNKETGEIITKIEFKKNYITLKTIKYVERNKYGTGGIITYTNICRRNQQQKLPFNNT